MLVVYSDINTRAINKQNTEFLTSDAKAVFQSIWRLLTTIEGEIPYYRGYGCNFKRFLQFHQTSRTADLIFEYAQAKVNEFEPRGRIVSASAEADISKNTLSMKFYVQVEATGETGVLPDLNVIVNGN